MDTFILCSRCLLCLCGFPYDRHRQNRHFLAKGEYRTVIINRLERRKLRSPLSSAIFSRNGNSGTTKERYLILVASDRSALPRRGNRFPAGTFGVVPLVESPVLKNNSIRFAAIRFRPNSKYLADWVRLRCEEYR